MGWRELLIVLVLVLLIFGARRLPEIARAMGQAFNEFKKAKDNVIAEAEKPAPNTAKNEPGKEEDKAPKA